MRLFHLLVCYMKRKLRENLAYTLKQKQKTKAKLANHDNDYNGKEHVLKEQLGTIKRQFF